MSPMQTYRIGNEICLPDSSLPRVVVIGGGFAGLAFGMQSSFGGIGQMIGPLIGAAVFVLNESVPYLLIGGISILTALYILKRIKSKRKNNIHNKDRTKKINFGQ